MEATIIDRVRGDFAFAAEGDDPDFLRQAPRLRYVAAINASLSKKEFVKIAVMCGFHPATAAIQFAQSRKCSLSFDDGTTMDDSGRLWFNGELG